MRFDMHLDLDNDAFQTEEGEIDYRAIARELLDAGKFLKDYADQPGLIRDEHPLHDYNGNSCGGWWITRD